MLQKTLPMTASKSTTTATYSDSGVIINPIHSRNCSLWCHSNRPYWMDPKTQLEKKQKQKNHAALHLMGTKNTIPLWTKMWEQQKYSIPQKVKRQEEKKNIFAPHARMDIRWATEKQLRVAVTKQSNFDQTKNRTKKKKKSLVRGNAWKLAEWRD